MKQPLFMPTKHPGMEELGFSEGASVGLTPRTVLWPVGASIAGGISVVGAVAGTLHGWPLWSLIVILSLGFVAATFVSRRGMAKAAQRRAHRQSHRVSSNPDLRHQKTLTP